MDTKQKFGILVCFLAISFTMYYCATNGFNQLSPDFDSLGHIYAQNPWIFT